MLRRNQQQQTVRQQVDRDGNRSGATRIPGSSRRRPCQWTHAIFVLLSVLSLIARRRQIGVAPRTKRPATEPRRLAGAATKAVRDRWATEINGTVHAEPLPSARGNATTPHATAPATAETAAANAVAETTDWAAYRLADWVLGIKIRAMKHRYRHSMAYAYAQEIDRRSGGDLVKKQKNGSIIGVREYDPEAWCDTVERWAAARNASSWPQSDDLVVHLRLGVSLFRGGGG